MTAELCSYCDAPMDASGAQNWSTRTRDHIVPKVLGGDKHPLNLTNCCKQCNHLKGGHSPATLRILAEEMRAKAGRIEKIADRTQALIKARNP